MKKEEETPTEPAWGRNRRDPDVSHQVFVASTRNMANSYGCQKGLLIVLMNFCTLHQWVNSTVESSEKRIRFTYIHMC